MICQDCGTTVELNRDANRMLAVQCDCEARGIKVATALPEGWSA